MAPVVAPETLARKVLLAGLERAFKGEGYEFRDDRLHGALGLNGTTIGVYPVRSRPWGPDHNVAVYLLCVQFYGEYEIEANPELAVSPSWIEEKAERFRQWLRPNGDHVGTGVWWFTLEEIRYPTDPTGNNTRFEAMIVARGNNTAVLETG